MDPSDTRPGPHTPDPPTAGPRTPDPPTAEPPARLGSRQVIACDDCAMQCTARCDDCVVTYFVRRDEPAEPLVLDHGEAQVVHLLARAGLVPDLHYRTG